MPGLAARPATHLIFPLAPDSGLEAFLATDDGIVHTAGRRRALEGDRRARGRGPLPGHLPAAVRGEMRKNR